MPTQSSSLATLSADMSSLAREASRSSVALRDRGRWFSGFHWRPDVIVTAAELVAARNGATIAVVTPTQEHVEGTVIGRDPSTDIALIRVGAGVPAVAAATPAQAALGQTVLAAGRCPHGPTCAIGFVALAGQPWRSMRGGDVGPRIWLDMRLPSHGEGSAVFDTDGRFLGMSVLGPRRRVLLIPAEAIGRVGQELLEHGRIRRGYLGVGVQAVAVGGTAEGSDAAKRTGVMIISLDPKGPAARSALQQGDIILAFDGGATESVRSLSAMLRNAAPGHSANIDISRSGSDMRVSVTLGESPTA
jgi:S1-C subfamily serine protease